MPSYIPQALIQAEIDAQRCSVAPDQADTIDVSAYCVEEYDALTTCYTDRWSEAPHGWSIVDTSVAD